MFRTFFDSLKSKALNWSSGSLIASEENFYQVLSLDVEDYLKKSQGADFLSLAQNSKQELTEEGLGEIQTIDQKTAAFLEKHFILYELLQTLFMNKRYVEKKKAVLDFLKIDFTRLQTLFYWADHHRKYDGFLIDCFCLPEFESNLFGEEEETEAVLKNRFLSNLFLFSLEAENSFEGRTESYEKITIKLLEKVEEADPLKSGIYRSIEKDYPELAEKIFKRLVAILPESFNEQELQDILSRIDDQKHVSYRIWTGIEKAVETEKNKWKEDKFSFFTPSTSVSTPCSDTEKHSFSAPVMPKHTILEYENPKRLAESLPLKDQEKRTFLTKAEVKKETAEPSDGQGPLKLEDLEGPKAKIRMPKLKLKKIGDQK